MRCTCLPVYLQRPSRYDRLGPTYARLSRHSSTWRASAVRRLQRMTHCFIQERGRRQWDEFGPLPVKLATPAPVSRAGPIVTSYFLLRGGGTPSSLWMMVLSAGLRLTSGTDETSPYSPGLSFPHHRQHQFVAVLTRPMLILRLPWRHLVRSVAGATSAQDALESLFCLSILVQEHRSWLVQVEP
jgi:hypothetical protein